MLHPFCWFIASDWFRIYDYECNRVMLSTIRTYIVYYIQYKMLAIWTAYVKILESNRNTKVWETSPICSIKRAKNNEWNNYSCFTYQGSTTNEQYARNVLERHQGILWYIWSSVPVFTDQPIWFISFRSYWKYIQAMKSK